MRSFWRVLIAAAALVAVAALGFVGWIVFGPGRPISQAGTGSRSATTSCADPTGVPANLKDASLIDRGRYLIRAADCEACHTAGGTPFAGGEAFVLPFGTIYSTNITPDTDTGIGQYTDSDFLAAVHRGVRRDGARLYPAMPFASYTFLTDADALAIKAYLFSLTPINAPAIPDTFAFPFDQRWAMGVWAMMFNANRRFEPHANQSAEWNRGAYLVEALAHCGECHTPRNLCSRRWTTAANSPAPSPAAGAPTTSPAIRQAASGHGLRRRSRIISPPDMPRGAAPRQGRWAKRSTSASCI